ncbi:amidohydrolase family protein [Actinacidiphila sp. ITFR-21]|uniref:amidohydrolase family protein n=1 Tax=Actinacidiphila sp. ITFR-21 TaxID=3075199 RepID=UPI0037DA438C
MLRDVRLGAGGPELVRLMARAAAHGIHPAVHAIGDRADTIALDAFDRVGGPGRIEHAQLVARRDLRRFARPGLVLGVQPAHAVDDRDVADRHWAGRTGRAYAYAELLRAGAALEIGSDAPVSPLDPWVGVAAAVHRTGADGRPSWHPEQAVTLPEALAAAGAGAPAAPGRRPGGPDPHRPRPGSRHP